MILLGWRRQEVSQPKKTGGEDCTDVPEPLPLTGSTTTYVRNAESLNEIVDIFALLLPLEGCEPSVLYVLFIPFCDTVSNLQRVPVLLW
jgi:hypothetical protein